ncbi:TPA: hypothetical protein JD264_24060 [Serratia fonticola]|nr:hypothetical protein [Serratia fonticola]
MTDFQKIVKFYRASDNAVFDGISIIGTSKFCTSTHEIICDVLGEYFSAGRFNQLEIDGETIDSLEDLPEVWSQVSYDLITNQSDAVKFYKGSEDFISASCLSKGFFPREFFIVDHDFYSTDTLKPVFIVKIEKILSLINALAKIAHYHDIKSEGSSSFYRLVFVMHSESKSTSAIIETNLTKAVLEINNLNIDLINGLVSNNRLSDAHYEEKINTFRNTLIEFIVSNNSTFPELINDWDSVNKLYSNNLAVYMSAFSFHKIRKEIADTEIDYAEKTSKSLLELSNKVLAIPISLVGSIAIIKLTDSMEITFGFSGVLLTTLIMHLVIYSQYQQLLRVTHAKNIVFSSIFKKIESEEKYLKDNSELNDRVSEAKINLDKNEIFCKRVLFFLLYAAWLPVSAGALIILIKVLR